MERCMDEFLRGSLVKEQLPGDILPKEVTGNVWIL
jgi:hypothetical protein